MTTASPARGPVPPKPEASALPEELLREPRWVCWRWEPRNGKQTKVPIRPDGQPAKSNDPSTWTSFEVCLAASMRYTGLGIGLMLGDGVVGVDLDHARDPESGALQQWAQEIIDELNSYTEVSPSGTGVHILCRGELPAGRRRKGQVEMYSEGRFFTVTGQRLNDRDVEDRTAELAALHARIFGISVDGRRNGHSARRNGASAVPGAAADVGDQELIQRASEAKDGAKFARLWAGQWEGEYSSQSEADLALCNLLAFWAGGDAGRIDRLFRQSGLMREKWLRDDYRQATIEAALSGVRDHYSPQAKGNSGGGPPKPPEREVEGPRTKRSGANTAPDWRTALILNKDGTLKPLLANAITMLRHSPHWQGVMAFNEFSELVEAIQPPPFAGGRPGVWSDDYDRRTADWLQHQGIYVSPDVAGQAAQTVAMERRFHPVRDYLARLTWDGVARIDDWLTLYLGVEPNEYTRAVGARWLISAVARIYKPGVKADHCLILEGQQGALKSTALAALAEPWFTDEISDLGTKDASLQTRGVWLIEMAELDAMRRSDLAKVKAFISRSTDRFRPPYGKRLIESPRQCVFAATTNQDAYLQDETGGRRFWPVRCGAIHIEELRRDRDQLWAEAVVRFKRGDRWWLDSPELNAAAAEEQEDRFEGDPWDPIIRQWIASPCARPDGGGGFLPMTSNRESVTVADILTHAIGKRPELWTQHDKNRVARCLRAMKWERYRARTGEGLEWRYRQK